MTLFLAGKTSFEAPRLLEINYRLSYNKFIQLKWKEDSTKSTNN